MLEYVKKQLAASGIFNESVVEDPTDDDTFLEAAYVLDELSDLSSEGTEDPSEMRRMSAVSIPVEDDFELDTVEFNMADGRITDIPMDAALQESYYKSLKTRDDFYAEGYYSVTRLPRESDEMFEMRVDAKVDSLYNEYMETIVQEGLFGFGEIKITSPEVIWRIHINFGKLKTDGGEYNASLPVLYEAPNKKILKKQLDCVKYWDYCRLTNAYDDMIEFAKSHDIKVPKDGNIWDVFKPDRVCVPREPKDQYRIFLVFKNLSSGKEEWFSVSTPIRSANKSNPEGKSMELTDNKTVELEMKKAEKSNAKFIDQKETASFVESAMPSRWDNVYQEAINFGGAGDPPELAGAAPAQAAQAAPPDPTSNATPPAPDANAAPPAPDQNININVDDTANEQPDADMNPDSNQPTDPPAPENPNVNDVSDRIVDGVNNQLDAENTDANMDLSADVNEEPNFDLSPEGSGPDVDMSDVGGDPTTDDASPDLDESNPDADTSELEDPDAAEADVDVENMTINQLIEQAQEKAKEMTIDQLKAFLSNNDTPGSVTDAEGITESFIYTKSNINSSLDVLLRKALGILNDQNLELSKLIKEFKKNGKKLNKALNKATRMPGVYDEQEKKQMQLLNRCLVDLMSMVREDSSQSNTQTARRLVKAFTSQARAVGEIIDRHKKSGPERLTQEGAITALFNIREKLERRSNFVHVNVTLPIRNKVEGDKLTAAFIKSYFKSDISKHTSTNGSAHDDGNGSAYGTGSSTTRERETDNPHLSRLDALADLNRIINSKERKRAKFSESELNDLNRTATLANELKDDIKSILKADIEDESAKLLKAIGEEACELDELCKKFHK